MKLSRRAWWLVLGGSEALGDVLPVDDLPDVLEVVGAGVLVVEVVGCGARVWREGRRG